MGTRWQQIPFLEKWTIKLSSFPSCWQKCSSAYPANAATIPVNMSKGRKGPSIEQPDCFNCLLPPLLCALLLLVGHNHTCFSFLQIIIFLKKQNHMAPLPSPTPHFSIKKKKKKKKRSWKPTSQSCYISLFRMLFSPLCYWGLSFESVLREWRSTHVQIKVTAANSAVLKSKAKYSNSIPSPAWSPTSDHTGNDAFFKFQKGRIDPQHRNG